jgi:hypothetical protein
MEEIIKPVSKELLKAELTEDRRLRMTNKSNNQIYIITHQNAPNVMREIGRLREIAFRAVEERACRWISTNTTRWNTHISS